jgi:hypothetical protein
LWYRGKYAGEVNLRDHTNTLEMTRSWPTTKQQYWELLNQSYELKSYDVFTGANVEAHLWGVDVKVWNGDKFIDYVPPDYFNDMIIDDDKDLFRVAAFVKALQ